MATPATGPAGVILAGGLGRRLGGDKALRLLAGRPLAAHVAARLSPQVGPLWLNTGATDEERVRLSCLGLPLRPDPVPGRPGPLAGVLAGLDAAAELGLSGVVSAPTDTPFLPVDLVARLCTAAGPDGVAIAAQRTDGMLRLHPVCALWPVRLRPALRAALAAGEARVGRFACGQGAAVAEFDDPWALFNVNTPDDLAHAAARLATLSPGGSTTG